MPFKRDLFTGELIEVPSSGQARQIIYVIEPPVGSRKTYHNAWSTPHRADAMGVPIEQMGEFNEWAKRNGTGARYEVNPRDPRWADLVSDSRGTYNRELKARGKFNRDGGWGDAFPE